MVGLVTYFIAGAVIMRVRFDATGADLIPNRSFWAALPGLIWVILLLAVATEPAVSA